MRKKTKINIQKGSNRAKWGKMCCKRRAGRSTVKLRQTWLQARRLRRRVGGTDVAVASGVSRYMFVSIFSKLVVVQGGREYAKTVVVTRGRRHGTRHQARRVG